MEGKTESNTTPEVIQVTGKGKNFQYCHASKEKNNEKLSIKKNTEDTLTLFVSLPY